MPRSCWCRCWWAPRDAVKCSGAGERSGLLRAAHGQRGVLPPRGVRRAGVRSFAARVREGALRMTVGVPGTGIGGMFYLVSALAVPLRQAYRSLRRRPSAGWRIVAGQTAMAGGILAAIWVTGWLLGIAITASAAFVRPPHLLAGAHPGNVLRTAALVLSAATLAA